MNSPALDHQQRVAGRQTPGEKQIYTVRSGDNLWLIGKRMGVSVKDLLSWNGLNANSTLRPGQKLSLWNPVKPAAKAQATADNRDASKDYPKNEEGHIRYTVKKGDTLWMISQTFGVTVAQLQKWNKLTGSKPLQPGQTLVLMDAPALAAGA